MRKMVTVLIASIALAGPAFAHGMSEADRIRAAGGGIIEFLRQGAVHMITGYDHLLFLFAVIFFLSKFRDIVKFITAFTLGHCITLIGATFLGIQANYYLIDAVIALTVCYKGFDNVGGFQKYLGMKSPNLLAMVFVFGLIHGFGLSTRLQTLTIGSGFDLLGKILAFNVGVEFGQIAALVVMLGLLAAWRHTESFQRFSMAANTGLIIVGGMLLMMQLHGYGHQNDPMAVGNLAKHMDAHEDLRMTDVGTLLPAGHHVDTPGGTPHAHHGSLETLLPGDHVDTPGGTPHADHGPSAAAPHEDHGPAQAYDAVIDRIFETRKAIKSAKSDAEVLEVHHPVSEIHKDLVTLRGMVADYKVDHALFDAWLKDATEAAKLIEQEAHEGNAAKTRELIARFDKGILAIEDLIHHPAAPGTSSDLPPGYHVDTPGGVPHATHGPAAAAPHEDHGPAQAYDAVIDRIFETRKAIKSAKSDAEVLEVHHPVSEIHKDLVTLRGMVADYKVDHALFDAWLKDATEAAKLIEQEAHEGNAAKTRELIARFDKGILGIEDLIHHPAAPGTSSDLPVGYHVDSPGGEPHKAHGEAPAKGNIPVGYHVDPGDSAPHKGHSH